MSKKKKNVITAILLVLFIFSIGFANQEIPPSLRVLKLAPHKTEIPVKSKTCLNNFMSNR